MDEGIRHIDFYGFNETVLNPVSVAFAGLMVVLVLAWKKDKAVIPLIAAALFITDLQRLVAAGLDIDMLRVVVFAALLRAVLRNEHRIRLNRLDLIILAYNLAAFLAYCLLWRTSSALINRLGFTFDVLGMYFSCRIFLRDFAGVERCIRSLAIMSVIVAAAMALEWITGRNLFAFMGGVPQITVLREGRLRAQGAFTHPILAGSFGAAMMPLMVGLWVKSLPARPLAACGLLGATVITVTCSSSGPLLAFVAGVAGLLLWNLRAHMRQILWSAVGLLAALALYMKAPVWALVARVSVLSGSTGWHRFMLIDQAVRRFPEWFLLGTRSTAGWGWGLQDVTNMYIGVGVRGGVTALALFVASIVVAFQAVGNSVRLFDGRPEMQYFTWAVGVSLLTHTVSFIGVSYFGHISLFWYLALAMIAAVAEESGALAPAGPPLRLRASRDGARAG